jgi:hypothetical protein
MRRDEAEDGWALHVPYMSAVSSRWNRELRRARKITQVRVAKALGIRQEGISRLEKRSDLLSIYSSSRQFPNGFQISDRRFFGTGAVTDATA